MSIFASSTRNQCRRRAFIFLMFCLLFLAQNADAQKGAALFDFSSAKAVGNRQMSAAAIQQQDININFDSLLQTASSKSALISNEKLQIPLLDGKIYEAVQSESEGFVQYNAEEYTWRGKINIDEFSGDVILTVKDGAMSGLIYSPTAVYEIIPQENSRHLLVELDQSLFPDCGGSPAPPTNENSKEQDSFLEQSTREQQPKTNLFEIEKTNLFEIDKMTEPNGSLKPQSPQVDNGNQLDVMVVYSDDVRAALGGTSQAQAFAQEAVALTNAAYQNSGINTRVRLVYSREISYDETPGTLSAALNWVTANATLAADRNTYKADMVAFIVEGPVSDGCGLAWTMNSVSSSFAPNAFSTTPRSCTVGNLSFPHELGHNQGANHNPEDAPSSGTAYPYGYGHYIKGSFRTEMSYDNPCPNNCMRVPYFSNPSVSYNGQATGIANQRDNARVLNNTAYTVSNFRDNGGNNCTYSAPGVGTWNDFGGTGSFVETTQSGCWWQATSSASWLFINSGNSGIGSGTVAYTIDENYSSSARTATITVGRQNITVTQSGAPACSYSLGSTSRTVDQFANNYSFTVSPNRSFCTWSAAVTSGASWLAITSGSGGTGSRSVDYSVTANTGTSSRTGTIVAGGQTFTVTQAGQSCSFSISPTSASIGASGGSVGTSVATSNGCAWSASSNADWISIAAGGNGSGSGTVGLSVASNTTTSQRIGTVTIAGQTYTVSQDGQAACRYSISPPNLTVSADVNTVGITVTAPAGCAWTTTNNLAWAYITSGASGSGSGTVYITVAQNTGNLRSGAITIAGQNFSLGQTGSSCSYSISPTTFSFANAQGGGYGYFSINAPAGCSWSAVSDVPWLTFALTPSSGSGNGTIYYTPSANTGGQRTGIITVAGLTHTVTQAAAAPSYKADVQSRPSGDGFVDSDDIQQIRRFSVGLDSYQSNEFQRADCSPRGTGDGFIDSDDIQQARRYSVALDSLQLTNRPTVADGAPLFEKWKQTDKSVSEAPSAKRALSVGSAITAANRTVSVPINIDTIGDETSYTFSVNYNNTYLTATNVTMSSADGNVIFGLSTDPNNTTLGRIGISVTGFSGPNGTIAPVTNGTLVTLSFTVAANAPAGTAVGVVFSSNLSRQKVSGFDPSTPLPQPSYSNGTITIAAPTAAAVTVGGRVMTAAGRGITGIRLSLTDSQGNVRAATTTSFGYYRFDDVEVGKTYILSASGKHYSFSQPSQVLNVYEETDQVNFTGNSEKRLRVF